MHFGENQLSRSLIGLSPLTTGHPPTFQRWWVRPSTKSYLRFSLPMARSLRFGSRTRDYNALFGLAFATAPPPGLTSPHATNSQAHSSKGTPSPTHTLKGHARLRRIVGERFQVLFHSPPGVLFTIPSRYYPLSVTREYSALPGGPGRFTADYRSPPLLGTRHRRSEIFAYRTLTVYGTSSQTLRLTPDIYHSPAECQPDPRHPTTPHAQPLTGITHAEFRLHPLSLATTHGITIVFSSCRY